MNFQAYKTEGFTTKCLQTTESSSWGVLLVQRINTLPVGNCTIVNMQSRRCCTWASRLTFMGMRLVQSGYSVRYIPRIVEAADWDYIERGLKQ